MLWVVNHIVKFNMSYRLTYLTKKGYPKVALKLLMKVGLSGDCYAGLYGSGSLLVIRQVIG